MYYEEQQARELVIKIGLKLKELGLVARTWGNISARISDTQFVITPSGRPYDTITPEQTIIVDINTWKYESSIRPSEEMGIHADAYKLRPDVNFIIHTHQVKACVLSAIGLTVKYIPQQFKNIVGDCIPCADYGLPSTKKLCKGVRKAFEKHPNSKAVIMKHHGAVCLGADYKQALRIALAVEEVCEIKIKRNYLKKSKSKRFNKIDMINYYLSLQKQDLKLPMDVKDFGSSERIGDKFKLTFENGQTLNIDIDECLNNMDFRPAVAKVHARIYAVTKMNYISHLTDDYILALSIVGKTMIPYLDDYVKIAGVTIKCENWNNHNADKSSRAIEKSLKDRNAVLIKNMGAIITVKEKSDIQAIRSVMSKGCETAVGVKMFGAGEKLPYTDRYIMRNMYLYWYTKQVKKQR